MKINRHDLTGFNQTLIALGIFVVVGGAALFSAPSLPVASNTGISLDTNGILAGRDTNFFVANSNAMERGRSTASTNNLRTELTNIIQVATNAATTNFQQKLTDSNVIAIARANTVGTGGTNAIATATNSLRSELLQLLATKISPYLSNTFALMDRTNGLIWSQSGYDSTIADARTAVTLMSYNSTSGVWTIAAPLVLGGSSNAGAGKWFFLDTNGVPVGIGSAQLGVSNAFWCLPTNGNGGQTHAFWVSTLVSGTNYQLRPAALGSGVAYETATSTLVATNVPDQAITSPRVTFTGPTNTLALNNGRQDFAMTTNCSITNVSGAVSGETRFTSVTASNSTPTTQHFYIPSGWSFFGTLTTNDFAVPSGKRLKLSVETIGTVQTNAAGLLQAN